MLRVIRRFTSRSMGAVMLGTYFSTLLRSPQGYPASRQSFNLRFAAFCAGSRISIRFFVHRLIQKPVPTFWAYASRFCRPGKWRRGSALLVSLVLRDAFCRNAPQHEGMVGASRSSSPHTEGDPQDHVSKYGGAVHSFSPHQKPFRHLPSGDFFNSCPPKKERWRGVLRFTAPKRSEWVKILRLAGSPAPRSTECLACSA